MLSPVSPLADSATMNMLGEEKGKYGRLRLGGTIGFALAAPLAGKLAQQFGLETTFRASAFLFILAFFASRQFVQVLEKLPAKSKENQASGSEFLWKNPRWLIFLAAALGGGFAMAFSNNYFFPYMKELGAGESTMGLALTLGTICEVPVMFFGHWLLGMFKPYRLFILSLVITGARLVLFSFAGNPTQALFIQALSGLTFPAMWLAGVAYVDENAPAGMSATAQGIFGAVVFGVGTALGGFVGGGILESLGARSMCLIFGSITLVIVALVLLSGSLLSRRQTEKAVI
jgi:PPP family 3-phenylpropionic acid transporter